MANKKNIELSTNNYIAVVAVVVVLVLAVAGIAAQKEVKSILFNNRVLAKKQVAAKQTKSNLEAAPQLISAYQNLGVTQQTIAHALPTGPDISGLISLLEAMAGSSGVNLKSVSPSALTDMAIPDGTTTPQSTTFTVSLQGNYDSLQSFLGDLELSARPMRATGVQMSGTSGSLTATLNITTFYQSKAVLDLKHEAIK